MNRAKRYFGKLQIILAAAMVGLTTNSYGATLCTNIIQSPEYPIPMSERKSSVDKHTKVVSKLIELGDKAVAKGNDRRGYEYYARVFKAWSYRDIPHGRTRCAPEAMFADAAAKLQQVAKRLAEKRKSQDRYFTQTSNNGHKDGVFRIYLVANLYDEFVNEALAYAQAVIMDRDIDSKLQSKVAWRLTELEGLQKEKQIPWSNLTDDSADLLPQERAAFTKLKDFDQRLAATLAPLYPKITQRWLDEEAEHFKTLSQTAGAFARMASAGQATGAINSGLSRLKKHPNEIQLLKNRANKRGETLFEQQHYEVAQDYFRLAGNSARQEESHVLAQRVQKKKLAQVKAEGEKLIEKMKSTDVEKAAFEADSSDMAAEFGFDLDE